MAETNLNIKITADSREAQANLSQLTSGIATFATEAQKLGGNLTTQAESTKTFVSGFADMKAGLELAQMAVTTFADVFKTAFEWGKEGAVIVQTTASFATMLEVMGAAPDLLAQLKKAAGGTIPELELMSSTSTLLAGAQGKLGVELANATPRLLEIARAANKLNPALGDATFLYQSLATGVKRASPMILDNLGLTIKLGAANETMAMQLGKSVEELTNEEKQMALLNATLEAGDVLIAQVGGSVESAVDPFARLETSVTELKNSLLEGLAPALSNAAEGANLLLTWQSQLNDAMAEHSQEILNTSTSYEGYLEEMRLFAEAAGMQLVVTDELTEAQAATMGAVLGLTAAQWDAKQATEAVNVVTTTWADSSFYAEQAQYAARDATLAAKDAMEEGKEAAENIASAFTSVGLAAYDAQVMTTLLKVATGGLSSEEATLQLNLLDVQQAVKDGTVSLGDYFNAMLDGKITTEEYNALLGEQVGVLGEQASGLDLVEQEMIAVKQRTGELSSAIEAVPRNISINFEISVTGDEIPNVGGYGNGAPTGPYVPTAKQTVDNPSSGTAFGSGSGGKPKTKGGDWWGSLTTAQQARIGELMGGGYGLEYAYELVTGQKLPSSGLGMPPNPPATPGSTTGTPPAPSPASDPGGAPMPGMNGLQSAGNTIVVMLDGREIAAHLQTYAGSSYRNALASGAGLIGS